jgi:hypothetical protein
MPMGGADGGGLGNGGDHVRITPIIHFPVFVRVGAAVFIFVGVGAVIPFIVIGFVRVGAAVFIFVGVGAVIPFIVIRGAAVVPV